MSGRLAGSGRIGLATALVCLAMVGAFAPDVTAAESVPSAGPETVAAPAVAPVGEVPQVSQTTEVFEVERVLDAAGRVERRLVPAADLVAGDELRYVIRLRNDGAARVEPGRIQVQTPVPAGARFLPGSAGGAGALVEYALDGATFSPHVPDLTEEPQPGAGAAPPPDTGAATDTDTDADTGAQPAAGLSASGGAPDLSSTTALEPSTSSLTGSAEAGSAEAAAVAEQPGASALTIRWTYQQPLDPGAVAEVFFHVRLF